MRSCLEHSYVTRNLGVAESDLVEVLGGVELADGSTLPAWTTPEPLRCEVLLGDAQPTGVTFDLDPYVVTDGDFLLGQADFFEAFNVTFLRGVSFVLGVPETSGEPAE
jgi:hypothetical protein